MVRSKEHVIIEKIIEIWIGTGIGSREKFLCEHNKEFVDLFSGIV